MEVGTLKNLSWGNLVVRATVNGKRVNVVGNLSNENALHNLITADPDDEVGFEERNEETGEFEWASCYKRDMDDFRLEND